MKVLVIDVGGTNLKVSDGGPEPPLKIPSGQTLTAADMARNVLAATKEWDYEAVSIGYPGPVANGRPAEEPKNLGPGWVAFDFDAAFARPVRVINDAAMQALGSYEGGRMLYLGLGTGLGSALIVNGSIVDLELGRLLHGSGERLGDVVGRRGLERLGKPAWREVVIETVEAMMKAFLAESVVIGGGNAKRLKRELPPGVRLGHNLTAFRGGFRLWNVEPASSAPG